ncbi:hypothetical protein RhiirC2_768024 [Rhizophagus irregularis]|uniref:Crinkler effector protein N-terminal domain-containing protein n=1 Tax=Rhizophagus irregularis TaxID=588596 RepID=A0A2N1P2U7_9GLOM|nr:hypothetical protein RhiirC2_768024 [Rhizophagus irregularis]
MIDVLVIYGWLKIDYLLRNKKSNLQWCVDSWREYFESESPDASVWECNHSLGCKIEILIDNLDDKSRAAQKVLSIKSELKGNASTNAFPIDIDGTQAFWKVEIPDDHDDQLRSLSLQNKDELLTTKKISKYFPVTPPKEHIHVIIKSPILLSLEEALSLIPPPIIYSPGCTTSKAITKANGSLPTRVLLWEDFFGEVNVKEISEILGTYNHFAKPSNNEQGKRSGSVSRLYPSKDLNPKKLCSPFASTRNTTTRTTYKNCKHSGKSSGQRSIPNTVNVLRIRKFEGQERLDPLQQGDGLELSHISTIMMFMLAILIMMIIKMENI